MECTATLTDSGWLWQTPDVSEGPGWLWQTLADHGRVPSELQDNHRDSVPRLYMNDF